MTARSKITAARTALVLDQPFFGVLALRLAIIEGPPSDDPNATAWTDGKSIGYNPTFIDSLTHAECVALIAHEVMHCALGHPWRRDARDLARWNHACDYAINPIITAAGMLLPEGALNEAQYVGKSAEWVYDRLPQGSSGASNAPNKNGSGGSGPANGSGQQPANAGSGQAQPGAGNKLGEVRDAPPTEAGEEAGPSEADWQQAVQEAVNAAKARGDMPGTVERLAKLAAAPRVDWRSVLRRFVQQTASADYSWRQPSRRYVARGLYLPALHSEQMGGMVIANDTSGSVDDVTQSHFYGEARAIAEEMQPEYVVIIHCDAKVRRVERFERGEPIEFNPAGGGGTNFTPVFDYVAKMEEQPVCLVYLTDLDGSFPPVAPEYPVLWAATEDRPAPFGEKVLMTS